MDRESLREKNGLNYLKATKSGKQFSLITKDSNGVNIMARFPLSFVPNLGYRKGSGKRYFGAKRSNGRKHAGCDLIAKAGTPIYAVDSGIIIDKYYFYEGTYALVVKHPGYIVRYGEIAEKLPETVAVGKNISEGQHIASVGMLSSGSSMLHFEMYSATAVGGLTKKSNHDKYNFVTPDNYQRHEDLLDPTGYLDSWRLWTNFTNWLDEKIEDIF
jgi:murein DD-endopeptidase MepM/ murein hydrolase activator NlpD